MKKDHLLQLQQTALFRGVDADNIAGMLDCLQAQTRTYKKGEVVFRQGEQLSQIAVVLAGKLHIQSDDYWGNHTIIADLAPGDLFGEAYVAPTSGPMLADVVCISDSVVALFQARRMLTVCTNACPFHSLVVQNLFYVLADKNRTLMQNSACSPPAPPAPSSPAISPPKACAPGPQALPSPSIASSSPTISPLTAAP